jgi:peptidoglycan hydrolase-like protein with peptidoglycan-binding domain
MKETSHPPFEVLAQVREAARKGRPLVSLLQELVNQSILQEPELHFLRLELQLSNLLTISSWEVQMTYRLAKSLDKMRDQFNKHSPHRNKASDGWIGDAKHAATTSDHNPWVKDGSVGIVTALDITHDPKNGVDTWAIAEHLRKGRDPRIKYVISNKRIFSSTTSPWTWRNYTGSNPHSSHIHVSVNSGKHHYDDMKEWALIPAPAGSISPDATPQERPMLRKGPPWHHPEHVKTVQRLLGLSLVDGKFGEITEQAVKAFQHSEHIAFDGIVGPITWEKLDKIEQIPVPLGYTEPRILSEPSEPTTDNGE